MGIPWAKPTNHPASTGSKNHANVDHYAQRYVLHRDISSLPPVVISDANNTIQMSTGASVYDASGGAAVACLGHKYKNRIWEVMRRTFEACSYVPSANFSTDVVGKLCKKLVDSTNGHMARAVLYNSGQLVSCSETRRLLTWVRFRCYGSRSQTRQSVSRGKRRART